MLNILLMSAFGILRSPKECLILGRKAAVQLIAYCFLQSQSDLEANPISTAAVRRRLIQKCLGLTVTLSEIAVPFHGIQLTNLYFYRMRLPGSINIRIGAGVRDRVKFTLTKTRSTSEAFLDKRSAFSRSHKFASMVADHH